MRAKSAAPIRHTRYSVTFSSHQSEPVVSLATLKDVDEIVRLIEANSADHGGHISPEFGRATIEGLLERSAIILTVRIGARLAGVLFSTDKEFQFTPSVSAMLRAWPGRSSAYVYGPVCIDERDRGKGLLAKLFDELKKRLPGREAVLFIERKNETSLRAHLRLGMRVVAEFSHRGKDFLVLHFVEEL